MFMEWLVSAKVLDNQRLGIDDDQQLRSPLRRRMHCNVAPQIPFADVSMQQPELATSHNAYIAAVT